MNVLLVGNSSDLLKQNNGKLIDSYDTVIRFNGGNPEGYEKHLGEKTDYWSFSTLRLADYQNWLIPDAVPMCLNMRIDYPVSPWGAIYNNAGTYRMLISSYGHPRPSTGLITAHYVKKLWKCDVSCIGFDFFQSGTWYRGSNVSIPHDGNKEQEFMKSLGVTIL